MALSLADKREIVAMLEAFSQRQPAPMTVEDMLMQRLISEATARAVPAAQAFTERQPFVHAFPEKVLGEVIETAILPRKRKKRMTQFNRAVKQTMKIFKEGTIYGKKGVINDSKKAFAAAAKLVSKVQHGKRKPKRGNIAIRKAFAAAAKLVKPKLPMKLPKRRRGR